MRSDLDRAACWSPRDLMFHSETDKPNVCDVDIEHFCAPVVHPVTGETISQYRKLMRDNVLSQIWCTAFGKEFGNLAQGDNRTGEKGTNSLFVMTHEQILRIPKDKVVTYGRIVIDYRPQKSDPNRVRITAGGNLIIYPGELTTRTADLTTAKVLWNSVVSTPGAKFMGVDIKSFYLTAPLPEPEYMKMPLSVFPQHVRDQYNLETHVKNGFVYLEIRRAIYGLPQAGILANKLLRERLEPEGYYEVTHTPGLWKHVSRPVQFSLVVDDFGVKYVGKKHADHLLAAIEKHYTCAVDWTGDLYCGIKLDWNYDGPDRYVDLSMPKYIPKLLQRHQHKKPERPQHSPYPANPRKYGTAAQDPLPTDESQVISDERRTEIQRIIGTVLFYARALDLTTRVSLSSLASEQTIATEITEAKCQHLLDYLATHPATIIRYYASDMILNIHSDASYLSEPNARSRVGGYFFLGSVPENNRPIRLNGAIHIVASILKFVVASAAEAELGGLFVNCKEGKIIRLILEELGHPQPPTPVHCDNATAVGIANDTVKKHRSRSMEMRYFWITDQVDRKFFVVLWHPGQENLADYFTKHFDAKHHQEVRPWYTHMHNSPRFLPRAAAPATLRGCAGTLDNGYLRSVPLPRVQLVSHMAVPNGTPQTSLIRVPRRHCPLPAALPLFT